MSAVESVSVFMGVGMGDIVHMYKRENACSLGSQASKVNATGTSLLLYYMWGH